jgi:peptidoglycan/LPS O-acetylase OafA/YrhL
VNPLRARHGWFTLADGLAAREDNFLLLRMLAAAAVIYGHAYAIVPHRGPPELVSWLDPSVYSGTLAVDIFFLVSGFLVTGSFLRRRHVMEFAWARALRVIPGYLVCLLGCAFVLGTLYTSLPAGGYLRDPATRDYVGQNIRLGFQMAWDLPGVFTDNPRRSTINGSLWTLPAEVRMYLWVAIAGLFGVLARRALCNLALLALLIVGLLAPHWLPGMPLPEFVRMAAFFGLGVFCYVNRESVPASGWLVVGFAALAWLVRATPMHPFALGLAEAAFAFWFAYRLRWHGYNRFGDYSYGVYLWGFPVQQVLAHHWPGAMPLANAALALPLALCVAVVSWHLVEKPSLALKRLPRHLRERFNRDPLAPPECSDAISARVRP